MTTDPATYDQDKLVELAGVVGAREFNDAYDVRKPRLWEWLNALPSLSDADFLREARHAIFESASCNRFRGNFEDEHCRATACYHESQRRHRAGGHDERCSGPTLYTRAYARVMRDHGYEPPADGVCRCPLGAEVSR